MSLVQRQSRLAQRDPTESEQYPGAPVSLFEVFGAQISRVLQVRQQQVARAFGRAVEFFKFVNIGGPKS